MDPSYFQEMETSSQELKPRSGTDILDAFLAGEDNTTTGAQSAFAVSNKNYKQLTALGNVSSFSMQEVFKRCPREYQWSKLEAQAQLDGKGDVGDSEQESNVDFAFGHAIGAAVATWDQTLDIQKARLSMFLAWSTDLFANDDYKKFSKKKSFENAWIALDKYVTFYKDELPLQDYTPVLMEATFAVDLEDTDPGDAFLPEKSSLYTGHIDETFQHKETGSYLVKENKTVGDAVVSPAKFQNSEQTTSYSCVMDVLGAQTYDVLYTIYSTTEQKWLSFYFPKSKLSKAEWLQDQLFIAEDIKRYSEANFFPKRGASCLRYGRECKYFGMCDMDTGKIFGRKFSELGTAAMADLDQIEPYHFKVKLSDLVNVLRQKEF